MKYPLFLRARPSFNHNIFRGLWSIGKLLLDVVFFCYFFFFSRHNFSFLIILGNRFFFFRPPFFSNGHHLLIRVYEYIYINIFFSSLHFSTLNQTQWWKLKSLIFSYFSVFFPFSILLMFPFPHLNRPYEMSYAYTYISKLCSDTNFE